MKLNGIYFARLIISNNKEYEYFLKKYSNTGILVEFFNYKNIKPSNIPGILINNNSIPILDLDILNIPFIITTKPNDIPEIEKKTKYLIDRLAYRYTPFEEITYDAILDEDFNTFISTNIPSENLIYLYFDRKCLYLYVSGKLISINIESLFCIYGDFKKLINNILNKYDCCIFSFNNFKKYVLETDFNEFKSFENIIWTKEQFEISEKTIFNYFGDVYIPKIIPYLMSVYINQNTIDEQEWLSISRFYKKDFITEWLSNQRIYFKSKIPDMELVEVKNNLYYCKVNYSNKRAITNRIYNHDTNFNIQTLPKQSEKRSQIVSRYKNGKIVVFDYISFEARIAIYTTSDLKFIEKFKNQDLHDYTSKIIFNKSEISKEERQVGKLFNHAMLYGGSEERLKSIIQNDIGENSFELIYSKIMTELNPIIEQSDYINEQYKDFGYVINPYGTVIRPRKNYAAFNNFIQSTASEIVIDKLFQIKKYIQDKKIHFMYQVFDSFVFDFNETELSKINEVSELLIHNHKINFPVEYKIGSSLIDCGVEEFIDQEI